jgi:uncharacterized membrane protein YedE/YeeE
MTDQPNSSAPPQPASPMFQDWTGADWFWLAVLIVSLLVGFGMTAFAPI